MLQFYVLKIRNAKMGFVFLFSNLAQDASQLKSVWMENVWINVWELNAKVGRFASMANVKAQNVAKINAQRVSIVKMTNVFLK